MNINDIEFGEDVLYYGVDLLGWTLLAENVSENIPIGYESIIIKL